MAGSDAANLLLVSTRAAAVLPVPPGAGGNGKGVRFSHIAIPRNPGQYRVRAFASICTPPRRIIMIAWAMHDFAYRTGDAQR